VACLNERRGAHEGKREGQLRRFLRQTALARPARVQVQIFELDGRKNRFKCSHKRKYGQCQNDFLARA
jgi:hypothetical protein